MNARLLQTAFQTVMALVVTTITLFAFSASANGVTTYTVTDTTDTINSTSANCAADGSGSAGEGNCTLRIATYLANTDGDDSRIILSERDTYVLTSLFDGSFMDPTVNIQWGDVDIEADHSLVIEGAGRNATTIDASAVSERVFEIAAGADVTIKKLTLTGGYESAADGGAINNAGTLLLQNVEVNGNTAANGGGVSMSSSSASLELASAIFDGNTAVSNGGAIAGTGSGTTTEIQNTTLRNNAAGNGGAILVTNGTLDVYRSLLHQNSATSNGAAIHVGGSSAITDIRNTTIGENTSANSGGAIYLNSTGSSNITHVISSTIVDNTAATSGSGFGGAIRAYDSGIDFQQSIVASNTLNATIDSNCSVGGTGSITSSDHNLESGTDCGFAEASDLNSIDPQLTAIADNGGLTETYAFDLSSGYSTLDAVDAIPASDCVYTSDQRGATRPDAGGGACDIGAYEVQDEDRDNEELDGFGGTDACDTYSGLTSTTEYYRDADGDGYYVHTVVEACESPGSDYVEASTVTTDEDCDDVTAAINPGEAEIPYDGIDNDCDATTVDDDLDGDGFVAADDCLDAGNATAADGSTMPSTDIYPGASDQWYNGIDEDCVGNDDFDQDYDGYQSATYATGGEDCVDDVAQPARDGSFIAAADINPAASDTWYDNVDQNCDGLSDHDKDLDGEDRANWDFDGDGVDDGGTDCLDDGTVARTDGNLVPADRVHSAATEEWYDGVDQDCSGGSDYDQDDDGDTSDQYDSNGDGVVDATDGTDCLDTEPTAYGGATEAWYDGVDQDCSGGSDYDQDGDGFDSSAELTDGTDCDDLDSTVMHALYEDADGDGLGEGGYQCSATATLSGYVDNNDDAFPKDFDNDGFTAHDDCDDTNEAANPGLNETPYDGLDNDCDADTADDDLDQDGFNQDEDTNDTNATVHPGAPEIADGVDNDGDGSVDEDTDVSDDDGDGLSENDGDCEDADANVGTTTTAFVDGDNDGDGAGVAVILCVAELPSGFSTNDDDPDDSDRTINSGFSAQNVGTFQSAAAAGNGDVTLRYSTGTLMLDVFGGIRATEVRYASRYNKVFVVSGDGKQLAMVNPATAQVEETVQLPMRKKVRGTNRIWVKRVKKGKNGRRKPTILIASDNRLVSVIYKKKTGEFGKKSGISVDGIKYTKPRGKNNTLNVKTLNGKVKLKMTKKGKLKEKSA